jgi:hypothetical protein
MIQNAPSSGLIYKISVWSFDIFFCVIYFSTSATDINLLVIFRQLNNIVRFYLRTVKLFQLYMNVGHFFPPKVL